MSFTRISAIVLRQYYLIRDNPTRFLQTFLWSVLDITLWGFVSVYLTRVTEANFFVMFLGGIVLWEFFNRTMNALTVAFFEDVWSRNFFNIFASPLTMVEYISGMVLAGIATTLLGFSIILLFTWTVFGFSIASYGFMALPFLVILFLSGIALGIVGISIVLRYGPSAEWFIWPLPAIIAPFVGVFYPISTLPVWMQNVALVLPPTYVFDGLRAVIQGEGIATVSLLTGFVLALFYILLAYTLFYRVYRRAIRTGLIARYSAETVT